MTVRHLPDEVHRRVKFVAAQRGISAEEAARQILDEGSRPVGNLGDVIVAFAQNLDVDFPTIERSQEPVEAVEFE